MGGSYEVLEAVRCKMHVLHEDKDPDTVVAERLLETLHCGNLALLFDGISLNALVGQDTLFWCEPAGDGWIVGQEPGSNNGNDESEDSLNDEEPAPSFKTCSSI